jgi:hypothetical protein
LNQNIIIWPFTFYQKHRDKIRYWLLPCNVFLFVVLIHKMPSVNISSGMNLGVNNFIAVNYLVYTNEVIGNIMESYPVVPLFSGLFIIKGTVTYFILKGSEVILTASLHLLRKIKISGFTLSCLVCRYWRFRFSALKKIHRIFFQMSTIQWCL